MNKEDSKIPLIMILGNNMSREGIEKENSIESYGFLCSLLLFSSLLLAFC